MIFDRTTSHLLDAVIYLIESPRPPWLVRFALRRWKAALEGAVAK